EMPRGLSHGVGRALKPVGAVGGLFGGEDLHESFREQIEPVGLRDVSVERRGVELRQHENALEPCMEAVADRDIDQPIFAANRHGRLRTHVRERKQPRAASAAEDERENIRHEAIIGEQDRYRRVVGGLTMFSKELHRLGHTQRFTIQAKETDGWEVREERDSQVWNIATACSRASGCWSRWNS